MLTLIFCCIQLLALVFVVLSLFQNLKNHRHAEYSLHNMLFISISMSHSSAIENCNYDGADILSQELNAVD